jgi:hypothetical protein
MISDRHANVIDDQPCSVPLALPRTFFMTVRDIGFWIRSARADARLNGCLSISGESTTPCSRCYRSDVPASARHRLWSGCIHP